MFKWSTVARAEGYELIVATEASLDDPVVLKVSDYALPDTTWECNVKLDYDTDYYWKVRAIIAESYSDWSKVGAFTTKEEPELPEGTVSSEDEELKPPENPEPPPEEPSSPTNVATSEPANYVVGPLLAAIILLSVIAFRLARGRRRPYR